MLDKFEDAVKAILDTEETNAVKYFGELSNPSKAKIDINKLPLIYIDYTGDKPINVIKKEHSFSLYITHISFSKNQNSRIKKHYELYELLSIIDEKLNLQSFVNSEPIRIGKTQKIYDQVTENGYLTVFKKDFTAILI